MFMMFLLSHFIFLALSLLVTANTEIVNFAVSDSHDAYIPHAAQWPVLNSTHHEQQFSLQPAPRGLPLDIVCSSTQSLDNPNPSWQPCPYETWLVLDVADGAFQKYSKFTLRLSWPTHFPSDVFMKVFNPEELSSYLGLSENAIREERPLVRRRYARIRIVDIGVPTPKVGMNFKEIPVELQKPLSVPAMIILEPLYFGVLPPTVVPVVYAIIGILIMSSFVLPRLIAYYEAFAAQARQEITRANNVKTE